MGERRSGNRLDRLRRRPLPRQNRTEVVGRVELNFDRHVASAVERHNLVLVRHPPLTVPFVDHHVVVDEQARPLATVQTERVVANLADLNETTPHHIEVLEHVTRNAGPRGARSHLGMVDRSVHSVHQQRNVAVTEFRHVTRHARIQQLVVFRAQPAQRSTTNHDMDHRSGRAKRTRRCDRVVATRRRGARPTDHARHTVQLETRR